MRPVNGRWLLHERRSRGFFLALLIGNHDKRFKERFVFALEGFAGQG
jgi:hypothetical protein